MNCNFNFITFNIKSTEASIISNALLNIVALSTDIFLPIFQTGCFIASFGLIFLKFSIGIFKKGPPDAVRVIKSTLAILFFLDIEILRCAQNPLARF